MHNHIKYFLFSFLIVTSILACTDENGNSFFKPKRIAPPSIKDRVALSNAENLGRSSWQKPAFIVSKLGDVSEKKIADIGSGTGYFTFHLAYLNAHVIAIDIDNEMLNYIETYKQKLPEEFISNIETRKAKPNNPLLKDGEIDHALIINTIGYISNLSDYLGVLRPGIKKGGALVIVDFKGRTFDVPAPPMDKIVPIAELVQSLEESGYTNIEVDASTLKYQYVVTAIAE